MNWKANLLGWPVCVLFLLAALCTTASGEVIYVDDDADGLNLGTSWLNAVNSLQDALLLACYSEKPVEIRVAQGVYTPDRGLGIMPGDVRASFQLMNGVTIKGGYAAHFSGGRGQTDIRDNKHYVSILSGDLKGDDNPDLFDIGNMEDNSYHVVKGSGTDETAVLDGFTITGSGISARMDDHSSGMYNDNGNPTVMNCMFRGNLATDIGAGMYNDNSNPVLLNCTFSENDAPEGGAGMYNNNSSPILTNCTFIGNTVGGSGSGMYNNNSKPVLLNCIFAGNTAGMSGGGVYNEKSAPTLTNCTFTDNSAGGGGGGGMYNEESISMLADCTFGNNSTEGSGGGIYNNGSKLTLLSCNFNANSALRSGGGLLNYITSEMNLTNCIFSGNRARDGGGMENVSYSYSVLLNCTFSSNFAEHAGGGISNNQNGQLTLVNCILWADTPDEIQTGGVGRGHISSNVEVIYSNVQNGWSGGGNINSDPLFADPENSDFHLKSQAGRWDPKVGNWVVDMTGSPCIDAGSPDEPVGLERFPNGGRINMGAYGGTPQASLSLQLLPGLSGQAFNPSPADGAFNVDMNIKLSWSSGLNAVSHNVYFGPDISEMLPVSIQQTANEIQLGTLDDRAAYYWRVDEVDSTGEVITGNVWTFTTVPPPKGRGCFLADTPLWIEGELVQISRVAAGQTIGKVACMANTSAQIEQLQEHEGTFACYDVLLRSGNIISVAENHYFMAESGQWLPLQDLKAGIKLKTLDGPIGIISVTKRPVHYTGKVYNLKVAGSERYLVGKDAIIVRDY
ncbi:MAG: hypothetical protein RQ760_14410 [Sedimentisphaerales bacterium]|nr:hypothetical protein [Sedimentisphaerales bacterium]